MSDGVLIALIAGASSAVTAAITALIGFFSNRKNAKAEAIEELKAEMRQQGKALEQHVALDAVNAQNVQEQLDVLKRHSAENYKANLWDIIRDDRLPLAERSEAAAKYRDCGYDGARGKFAARVIDEHAAQMAREGLWKEGDAC